jgi:hypothetical protein
MNLDALYQELHLLALHYHWAEHDILRLPTSKRRRYLRLLASHIGGTEQQDLS